jgi:hypothetical protein
VSHLPPASYVRSLRVAADDFFSFFSSLSEGSLIASYRKLVSSKKISVVVVFSKERIFTKVDARVFSGLSINSATLAGVVVTRVYEITFSTL